MTSSAVILMRLCFPARMKTDPSGGQPLDANFTAEDIEGATHDQMVADCREFLDMVDRWSKEMSSGKLLDDIIAAVDSVGVNVSDPQAVHVAQDYLLERGFSEEDIDQWQIRATLLALVESGELESEKGGADFWFSRNGHGAGFWDGAWGEDGQLLHDMASGMGGYHLEFVAPEYDIEQAEDGTWWQGFEMSLEEMQSLGDGHGPYEHWEEARSAAAATAMENGYGFLQGQHG